MDLLDRYLGAIAALLPAGQRQDIVAELRDVLMSRIEEKEAQQGRPLDKKALEALFRDFGHPLAVAGRYGPQRALIGVELYPFYIFAVKVALAIALVVGVIPAVVQGLTGAHGGMAGIPSRVIHDFIPTALQLIGVITIIGAMVERGWIKTGDFGQWRVSDLPHISTKKSWFRTTRFEALFEVIFMTFFALWWAGVVDFPGSRGPFGHDGELQITLAPILTQLHTPILLLAIGQALSGLILVIRPAWIRPRAVAEIVLSIAGIVLAYALWREMPLVTFTGPGASAEDFVTLRHVTDHTFRVIAVIVAAVCAGKILIEGWRLLRPARDGSRAG
ncbi:hypothetical protein ACN2C7_04475 [Caulobacter sp. ErkDOM-E]|uniref:hypothetical protein n=1 Tax=Caulobacter sp. ErkDOM-E TaxID=3402778 RepID=UPI003AF50208